MNKICPFIKEVKIEHLIGQQMWYYRVLFWQVFFSFKVVFPAVPFSWSRFSSLLGVGNKNHFLLQREILGFTFKLMQTLPSNPQFTLFSFEFPSRHKTQIYWSHVLSDLSVLIFHCWPCVDVFSPCCIALKCATFFLVTWNCLLVQEGTDKYVFLHCGRFLLARCCGNTPSSPGTEIWMSSEEVHLFAFIIVAYGINPIALFSDRLKWQRRESVRGLSQKIPFVVRLFFPPLGNSIKWDFNHLKSSLPNKWVWVSEKT